MQSSRYRWVIVATLWMVHAVNYLNVSSLGVLAPFLKADLSLSSTQIGLLLSAVSIGACIGSIPAGLITDRIGVRLTLGLAIGGNGFFWILFSGVPSYAALFALLLGFGMTFGSVPPPASKSILCWFPPIGRATAMGLKQTGVNGGAILGGLLLPFLALKLSWRYGLLIVGAGEIACAVLIYVLAKDPPFTAGQKAATISGKSILRLALRRDMLTLGLAGFFFFALQFCFSTYLALFLTGEQRYSVVEAGGIYAVSFAVGAAGRILWSVASDYCACGRRRGVLLLIAFLEMMALGALALLSFLPAPSALMPAVVIVFGATGVGWNAIYLTLLAEMLPREVVSVATGIGFIFMYLGSLILPPFFGFLIDTTGVYGYAWAFATGCAGAILLLLSRIREAPLTSAPPQSGREAASIDRIFPSAAIQTSAPSPRPENMNGPEVEN